MATTFDISPEKRASLLHYYYRQLFVSPPPVSRSQADLRGRTALITGSSSGLGIETARQLLELGCEVILAVRDETKGERTRQDLLGGGNLPPGSVQVWKLDLSSYDSIIAFAERARRLEHLDIAILSAGVFKVSESFSATGYEECVQINYLSNMLLALLLLPIIKEKRSGSRPGDLCVVSSDAAAWSKFEERSADPILSAFRRKSTSWNMGDRYATSKLLGQLFLTQLSKHVDASTVTLSWANPGFCRGSGLAREMHGIPRLAYTMQSYLLSRDCTVGARTLVHAVTTLSDKAHGHYIEDAKLQPMAPFVYSAEGGRLAKQFYEETLDELSFAGVKEIINNMSKPT